jgi:hypothetical protein
MREHNNTRGVVSICTENLKVFKLQFNQIKLVLPKAVFQTAFFVISIINKNQRYETSIICLDSRFIAVCPWMQ